MRISDWSSDVCSSDLPIACGGVAVFPDDLIVTDRDGAVVVPQALIQEVAELGLEQERLEGWIMKEVQNGAKLPGLSPINDENRDPYEAEVQTGRAAASGRRWLHAGRQR